MIRNRESLSMSEATEHMKEGKGNATELSGFIKKFSKISVKDSKNLRKKLEGLELIKIDGKDISKIIDLMPENEEELNKIFVGISLDEEEIKKILDLVKEFK
jgi:DNA-directed RNA polymerase subunit F